MTTGPWKPISLETYVSRITEIDIRTDISEAFQAKLDVYCSVSGPGQALTAKVKVLQSGALEVIHASDLEVKDGSGTYQFTLEKDRYELWYPIGYGQQPLYTAEITILDEVRQLISF